MIEYTVKVIAVGDKGFAAGTYWSLNGKHHRIDGPAIEYTTGDKHWLRNGQHHREDGPAIELAGANGNKFWYLDGKNYATEAEWKAELEKRNAPKDPCDGKIVEIDGVKYMLKVVK